MFHGLGELQDDPVFRYQGPLFSAHPCPRPVVQTSVRLVAAPIQPGPELANRFSLVYISHMCNLYSQTRNVEAIRRLFRIPDNRTTRIKSQPAIFPGWAAPVIRKAEDGERELLPMSWGFVLLQDGKAPRRVTNVRDDKILTSRFSGRHRFSSGAASCPHPAIASR